MSAVEPIRVLIVDDEEPPIRELKIGIEDCTAPNTEFVFQVESARSVSDYHHAIQRDDKSKVDVLIVDLKLDGARHDIREGVTDVISWQMLHSPETIIIVYSAFAVDVVEKTDPMVEIVNVCVQAMRAGARDCIKKGKGSVPRVVESMLRELRLRDHPELCFDPTWWQAQSGNLAKDYADQAVAILGKDVLASAETVPQLREKLKSSKIFERLQQLGMDAQGVQIILVPEAEE